jgi:hypothetical protein
MKFQAKLEENLISKCHITEERPSKIAPQRR